jgi:hypothetical protein
MSAARPISAMLALLSLSMTISCPGQTTTPANDATDLGAVVKQLGAKDWREREAAHDRLVMLGERAVPRLDELGTKLPDPAAKERLRQVVGEINASLVKPSLVSLKFKDAPAKDVYAELFKQAKVTIEPSDRHTFEQRSAVRGILIRPRPVEQPLLATIDAKNVSFWDAMVTLEKQTGLFVGRSGVGMCLSDEESGRGDVKKSFVVGAFVVIPEGLFRGGIDELHVFVDPRVPILGHAMDPMVAVAVDAKGNLIPPGAFGARQAGAPELLDSTDRAFDLSLPMAVPHDGFVRGTIGVNVATDEQTVEIDGLDGAKAINKRVDGRRYLVTTKALKPGEWSIWVSVFNVDAGKPALDGTRLEVVDAGGAILTPEWNGGAGTGDEVSVNMKVKAQRIADPPAKLRVTVTTAVKQIDVPFKFGKAPAAPGAGAGARNAGAAAPN